MSSQSRADLPQLSLGSSTLEDIMSRAYDSFDVQLSSLQFLYTKAGAQTCTKLDVMSIWQGFTYAVCGIRWWLEVGSSTETVCFSHPGACRPEGGLQQSHGGDGLTDA